jgi:hypothetical protein
LLLWKIPILDGLIWLSMPSFVLFGNAFFSTPDAEPGKLTGMLFT